MADQITPESSPDLSDFNPAFKPLLDRYMAGLAAAGIKARIISGYRTPELQAKLYANYQAKQAGRPLPYPNENKGALAAPAWRSFHNYGLAADVVPDNPADYPRMWDIAAKSGLTPLRGADQPHVQMPGSLNADIAQYHLAGWRPGGTMVASAGNTPIGVKSVADTPSTGGVDLRSSIYQMLIGKSLSPQQAMGIIYSMMGESGTGLDASSLGDSGKSLGFGQWNGERRANLEAIAKKMGLPATDPSVQLAHFKAEIDGPYAAEIENVKNNAASAADATRLWTGSVGEKSGYERPETNNWRQRFAQGVQVGSIGDDGAPVWKTPGTTTTSTPSTTTAPSTDTPSGPPKTVGEAIARLTKKDSDSKTSPLQDVASAFSPSQQQGGGSQSAAMLPPGPDTSEMLAGPSQQLLSQTMAAQARPLSWSVTPFGAEAGPQGGGPMAGPQMGQFGARQPGLTINSLSPFGYG